MTSCLLWAASRRISESAGDILPVGREHGADTELGFILGSASPPLLPRWAARRGKPQLHTLVVRPAVASDRRMLETPHANFN